MKENLEPVTATWCQSLNLGDKVTPFLIERMTGRFPIYSEPSVEGIKLYACGSILDWVTKDGIVWGSGIGSRSEMLTEGASVRCVRGPYTATVCAGEDEKAAKKTPQGDPALLLPAYIPPSSQKQHPIGFVPHYVDQQRAYWMHWKDREEIKIINILQPIETVVKEITECEFIFSSALHGLIVADAYGIPNRQVNVGDDIGGDGIKFWDYFASVGRAPVMPSDCRTSRELPLKFLDRYKKRWEAEYKDDWIGQRQMDLIDTCPFTEGCLK